MQPPRSFVLLANARLPSQRAQSLQVVQAAAALQRVGAGDVTLVHALRVPTPSLAAGTTLFDHYAAGPPPWPEVVAVPHLDWIERVPASLQFLPARAQEWSFSRRAARWVERELPRAIVLSREVEAALALLRRGVVRDVFLELHRVPGGRLRRSWLRAAAERARGIVAISGGVRDDLLAEGVPPERITVEHDGYEARRFEGLPDRRAARAALGLADDKPLVVYTGGLMAWKGVDVLVEAARRTPGIEYAIAGGTESDVARLRDRARGLANVRIDGFRAPGDVAQYLAAADVGVVPNRSEPAISARYTSPLKVFEAMACGLPLVVSDLPSLREILGADDAFFVAPDDPEALAEGVRRALRQVDGRERMRTRLLARAPSHTWDARARRLVEWMLERAGARS